LGSIKIMNKILNCIGFLCLMSFTHEVFCSDVGSTLGQLQESLRLLSEVVQPMKEKTDEGIDVAEGLQMAIDSLKRVEDKPIEYYSFIKSEEGLVSNVLGTSSTIAGDLGWDTPPNLFSSIHSNWLKAKASTYKDFNTQSRTKWEEFDKQLENTAKKLGIKKVATDKPEKTRVQVHNISAERLN